MTIRKATYEDLPRLMEIFSSARQIMRSCGNIHQWDDSYPSEEIVRKDISEGVCHVLYNTDGLILATMAFIPGPDSTYAKIYSDHAMTIPTSWPNERPYHVIHRIAAAEPGHGVFGRLITWALERTATIRIDTHSDNIIMHHKLTKHGFTRCGIIRLASGDARVAYINSL